ncbi:MAG: Rieske 2Fe-2S domain-containing protein [Elusimicrobia bacterium]|nr:Rieske 2Fe-2S domain-containing protein [Elusimicrobiota bacterium]
MPKIKIAQAAQIQNERTHIFTLADGKRVALRQMNETIYAFEDRCSHDDGEVATGPINEQAVVECPRHGARFDLKTGKAVRMPAIMPIEVYPVEVKNGEIWITIPESAAS